MGTLTIRKLDDNTKTRLRLSAARKGVSMEEEARNLIAAAVSLDAGKPSGLSAAQIMAMARALPEEEPIDIRFKTMTSKELSDVLSGEFDGL